MRIAISECRCLVCLHRGSSLEEDDETFDLACRLEESFSISNEISTLKDLSYTITGRHVGISHGIHSRELEIFDPETNVGLGTTSPNAILDIQTNQTQYWGDGEWVWGDMAIYDASMDEPMTIETVQETVSILEAAPSENHRRLDELRERMQNEIRDALDNRFIGSRGLQYEMRPPNWFVDSLDDISIFNLGGNIA